MGTLTPEMQEQGVKLSRFVDPEIIYHYWNLMDPIVGGLSTEKIALRRAIWRRSVKRCGWLMFGLEAGRCTNAYLRSRLPSSRATSTPLSILRGCRVTFCNA